MKETVEKIDEAQALAKAKSLSDPTKTIVSVNVRWLGRICVPTANSKEKESATFKVLTFGDNKILDDATSIDVKMSEMESVSSTDLNEYRRLLLRRNLLSWTLDIPIEREDGWMTQGCYNRVKNVSAPLINAFLDEYEKDIAITHEEEETIARQSVILFSKHSRGVANACDAVSQFCTLGSFWEKFGIGSGRSIDDMSYKDYTRLKMMMSRENEAMRVNTAPRKNLSRITGPGGRVMPSKGIVMEG